MPPCVDMPPLCRSSPFAPSHRRAPRVHAPFVVVAFPPRGGVVLLVSGSPSSSAGLTFVVIGVSTQRWVGSRRGVANPSVGLAFVVVAFPCCGGVVVVIAVRRAEPGGPAPLVAGFPPPRRRSTRWHWVPFASASFDTLAWGPFASAIGYSLSSRFVRDGLAAPVRVAIGGLLRGGWVCHVIPWSAWSSSGRFRRFRQRMGG